MRGGGGQQKKGGVKKPIFPIAFPFLGAARAKLSSRSLRLRASTSRHDLRDAPLQVRRGDSSLALRAIADTDCRQGRRWNAHFKRAPRAESSETEG